MQVERYPEKERWSELTKRPTIKREKLTEIVAVIFDEVKNNGDQSLINFAEKFDSAKINDIKVSQKEIEALDKYKLVLSQEPTNITALVKAAELSTMLAGFNEKDTKSKQLFLSSAGAYAVRAYSANPKNAEVAKDK